MKICRNFLSALMVLFGFSIFGGSTFGQSAKEIFNIDFLAVEDMGNSEKGQAAYFTSMGMSELEQLNNRILVLNEQEKLRRLQLHAALAELTGVYATTKGPETSEQTKKIMALWTDPVLAAMVFDAIGPDRAAEIALNTLLVKLESRAKTSSDNAYTPVSLLNIDSLGKLLQLTEDQQKQLDELMETSTEKMRYGSKADFDELARLLTQHWEKLLATLNLDQKKISKRLIGEPIQWFRSVEKQHLRGRNFERGGQRLT